MACTILNTAVCGPKPTIRFKILLMRLKTITPRVIAKFCGKIKPSKIVIISEKKLTKL